MKNGAFTLARAASLAGAADTAAFIATRGSRLRANPRRLAESLVLLGLWIAVASRSSGENASATGAVALSATLLAANAALLGAHLRHQATAPRVYFGPALALVALGDTLRRR